MKPQRTPKPAPKGPWEKRGGIPREKFPEFFKKGPFSITYSRERGKGRLKSLGEKLLKERFPGYYGRDISGSEIQREIQKLKRVVPKTEAEKNALREAIARLKEAKKRAGL